MRHGASTFSIRQENPATPLEAMANRASTGDSLVVRLVYDGPPRSGKTTSLRALAGSLARPHFVSEEAEGRTLYFDWLEYIGGNFEGMPIRCQIVSVPGQPELARRREALLASADAVIFVADTTGGKATEAVDALQVLRTFLGSRPAPRPGLVVQVNKRDQPDALPLETLRSRLAGGGMAFVESVATEGVGIREAFVLAVRLALDRVRERLASGISAADLVDAETPEELLARLKAGEADAPPRAPAAALLREVFAGEDVLRNSTEEDALGNSPPAGHPAPTASLPGAGAEEPDPTRPPRLPASDAPSGRVWPPITGRLLLHEVPAGPAQPQQGTDGSWRAQLDNWFFHSAREHHFLDLDAGRRELLGWARLHSEAVGRLAPRRCIVLADTGLGSWRLWQLIHHEPSLRQELWTTLLGAEPVALADALLRCAEDFLQAREAMVQEPPLPCRLELLGRGASSIQYVGVLPPPSWAPPAGELETDSTQLLLRELRPVLQKGLATARIDVPRVLAALGEARTRTGHPDLPETLSAMLIGQERQA